MRKTRDYETITRNPTGVLLWSVNTCGQIVLYCASVRVGVCACGRTEVSSAQPPPLCFFEIAQDLADISSEFSVAFEFCFLYNYKKIPLPGYDNVGVKYVK